MNAGMISLLAVTLGFVALVAWVFRPGSRRKMDANARIPFEEDKT